MSNKYDAITGGRSVGVDIYHGNNVSSFSDFKKSGGQFVIHKATQGATSIDDSFKSRWPQIKAAGLLRGAYLFFIARQDAKTQWELFKSVALPLMEEGDMPFSLDYGEYDLSPDNANREGALYILQQMEKESGLVPFVYGATGILGQYNLQNEFARYPLWAANLNMRRSPPCPAPWSTWSFYQYAEVDAPEVAGMGNGIDLDVFNGDLEALKNFIKASKTGSSLPPVVVAPLTPIVVDETAVPKEVRLAYEAMKGNVNFSNVRFIAEMDYSINSSHPRMFIYDLVDKKLEAHKAAHGSGGKNQSPHDGYCREVSNVPDSHMSCLGLFKCSEIYDGPHGKAIRLDGLSPTNSHVRARGIVLHRSDYVIDGNTNICGRSLGCPAVSRDSADSIISRLHGGSPLLSHYKGEFKIGP